jgi:nicotinamide N-methyltransferase
LKVVVKLKAGDAVFYNNNILHRGKYDASTERMTLHGSVGHINGGGLRARNVLQHGVKDWLNKIDFGELEMADEEKERAESMREKLVKLADESGDLGFSLKG